MSQSGGALSCPSKIILAENREAQRENELRLVNWGRWGDANALDRHGVPKGDAIFREYRPDSGDTWDGDPKPAPIDEKDAEAAEIVINQMIFVDYFARQVLIMKYYRKLSFEEIERFFTKQLGAAGWSVRRVKDKMARGQQLFWEMSR